MGYNTVVMLNNDVADLLRKSPIALAYGLSHPPLSDTDEDIHRWWSAVDYQAKLNGEPPIPRSCIKILSTFHADDARYVRAGGVLDRLKIIRYGKTKEGKQTVTLELPFWWTKKFR